MGVQINIPTPLRRLTNGLNMVEAEAASIGEVIGSLESQFPGMKERLVDETGEIRYFVNLYLNGEDVRFLQGMDTTIESGDEISIVPAVAGGSSST